MIRLSIKKIGHVGSVIQTNRTLNWGRQPSVCMASNRRTPVKGFSMDRTLYDNKGVIRPRVEEKRSPRFKVYGCASVLPQAINGLSIIDDERECLFKHYPINEAAERMMFKKTHTDNQKVESID
jgi:hypothetical protein